MILFVIVTVIYIGTLSAIRPAPSSLKAQPLSYAGNVRCIWATLVAGGVVIGVFLLTTDFTFLAVNENIFELLALNNDPDRAAMWPMQAFTHLVLHGNLLHLLSNLAGLGLASAYERRVGARRFLAVLTVSSLASVPSIFFYSDTIAVCGISGGVFGLFAAYFTDENELTLKEWLSAIALFSVIFVVLIADAEYGTDSAALDFQVDHLGHILGAVGAIIYCRYRPMRKAATLEAPKQGGAEPKRR